MVRRRLDQHARHQRLTASAFVNLDMRFAKRFSFIERYKAQIFFEFFNLLNARNPASVGTRQNVTNEPFGVARQVLPGREGQVGFGVEF